MYLKLQQNSSNMTCKGPYRNWIKYCALSDCMYTDTVLIGTNLLLLLYLRCTTNQGSILFLYLHPLVQGHQGHFVFWSLHSWNSCWSRRQGVSRYHSSCCTHSWRPLWIFSWHLSALVMKPFPGKRQHFLSWDYSPPDYHDFWILGCQIKGILLCMEFSK